MLAWHNQSETGDGVDPSTRELGLRLHELGKAVRLIRQQRADPHDPISPGTLALLLHIDEHSTGCHGRELAIRAGLDPSTVSRGVAALVAHGLVRRHADPADGRASVLEVTPAGRRVLDRAHSRYGEVLQQALADWTPDEVSALSAALHRFTDDVENTLGQHPTHRPDTLEAAR